MIRRLIKWVLIGSIVFVLLHDANLWLAGARRLVTLTDALAETAQSLASQHETRDAVASQIASDAARDGVTVYQYDQQGERVSVWTRTVIGGTWVLGPAQKMYQGTPPTRAWGAPFTITEYREAGF